MIYNLINNNKNNKLMKYNNNNYNKILSNKKN